MSINNDDDDDDDADDEDKELFLSNHTQSMRRALSICQGNYNAATVCCCCCCCLDGFRRAAATMSTTTTTADDNETDDTDSIVHSQRQAALQQLWKKLSREDNSSSSNSSSSSSCKNEDCEEQLLFLPLSNSSSSSIIAELDVINFPPHHTNNDDNVDYFVNNIHRSNQPCLVRGLDQTNFQGIMEHWGTPQKARTWFNATLGPERLLPIRKRHRQQQRHHHQQQAPKNSNASSGNSSSSSTTTLLDPDGRAVECETLEMSLREWICHLNDCNSSKNNNNNSKEHADAAADLYLKDWHLEQWLENDQKEERNKHRNDNNNKPNNTNAASSSSSSSVPAAAAAAAASSSSSSLDLDLPLPLYTLPDIFQQDLLNPFLHVTKTGGDYRFVYWGGGGSCTDWHSDVLHSFSWSFNVYGTKEWTFCLPPPPPLPAAAQEENEDLLETGDNNHVDDGTSITSNGGGDRCFVLRQSAGECVFVPATWKHQVVNLEETLSINRNWITTANLDLTWECLYNEIVAINRELASWSTGTCSSNTFTAMPCGGRAATTSGDGCVVEFDWEAHESMLRGCVGLDVTAFFFMILHRLLELLVVLSEQQQQQHTSDEQNQHVVFWEKHKFDLVRLQRALCVLFQDELMVCLPKRLAATLASPAMGREAVDMAMGAIDVVKVYGSQWRKGEWD